MVSEVCSDPRMSGGRYTGMLLALHAEVQNFVHARIIEVIYQEACYRTFLAMTAVLMSYEINLALIGCPD